MNRAVTYLALLSALAVSFFATKVAFADEGEYMQAGMAAYNEGRYAEAEKAFNLAVKAIKASASTEAQKEAEEAFFLLGDAALQRGLYPQAERYVMWSLELFEKNRGQDDRNEAGLLSELAAIDLKLHKYAKAEQFYKRSLALYEKVLGPDDTEVAKSLDNLATLYYVQRKYAEAEPFCKRAVVIYQKTNDPDLPLSLASYAALLRKMDRTAEAEALEAQARAIRPALK